MSPSCSNGSPFRPNWLVALAKKCEIPETSQKRIFPYHNFFLSQFDLISRLVLSPCLSFSIKSSVLKSTPNTIPEPTINIFDALHYSPAPRIRSCYSWLLLVTTTTSLNLSCPTANYSTSLTVSWLFRCTTTIVESISYSRFQGAWLELRRKHP